ncbi:cytochrome c-type biogenesis protein [Thalassolituus sp. LLYu03]|uniref:cytochrome c-type biogenesis protein n=1 Tax=Thalassolituus sp. LLYu03 TaxID=3421656 RepID=UPI003D2A001F
MKLLAIVTLLCGLSLPAVAVVEGYKYQFDNQTDTERFNQLTKDLRCPKCQNQDLADSSAPVASDMRGKIYDMMIAGKSDDEIVGYMVDRYGDFVHYTPPVGGKTFLLWFGPVLAFVFGLLLLALLRRGQKQGPAPLSDEEKARLQALKNKADIG